MLIYFGMLCILVAQVGLVVSVSGMFAHSESAIYGGAVTVVATMLAWTFALNIFLLRRFTAARRAGPFVEAGKAVV